MTTTRRDFLKASLGASTLLTFSSTVPGFLCRAALAAETRRDNSASILVVVQLTGGNDGLNTIVPYEDDAYHRSRPTLRLPPNRLHKLNTLLGLHPEMQAFSRLYQEGHLSIIQGVGYPNSNRNHDGALRDWHTAQPKDDLCQTGWIGRAIDRVCDSGTADLPGIFVGPIKMPFALQTEQAVVPSIGSIDQWAFSPGPDSLGEDALRNHLRRFTQLPRTAPPNPLRDFLQASLLEACATSQRLEAVARTDSAAGATEYPPFPLSQNLKTIAQLIRAEVGLRIYFAELGGGGIGGFDTHANQAANHGALLRELSESVAAFVENLRRDKLLDRVLLMTFSEFGRTVAENGRRGTDHGAAALMLLAGGKLKGGIVGVHPSLKDLEGGALKSHTDFRRVYATLLDRWLGFDSQSILGARYDLLDLLAG